ncbi:MAG: Hemolysins and related proteins containing CBS domains [uncultured Adhaeribacter sp.]|uniref:Hemolysins and related proteins containing CBS domains n=1 Tax=uncultured Adhaeribacter sp. TaxID=448109 RepID=A0A6J4IUV0_9BACT|nr:MAG: Hemolysins and related proteins containing CBS domains [uncultured Adhaeribacter sp.]
MVSTDPGGDPGSNGLTLLLYIADFTSVLPIVPVSCILLLLAASALVSGAEVAFFSLTNEDLLYCRQSSRRAEQLIPVLLQHPRRLLTTLLALDTIINISIVLAGLHLFWKVAPLVNFNGGVLLGLTLFFTFIIAFFGEVLPKVYANEKNLKTARRMARVVNASHKILAPVIALLLYISQNIENRYRNRPATQVIEELQQAIDAASPPDATLEEREILRGIVNFGSLTVKQIMCSRLNIEAVATSQQLDEVLALINQCEYSRIPVYTTSIDHIEGILYVKDLLPHLHEPPSFAWQTLIRPPYFVPEIKKVDDLLKDFQERHVHMAIVVDEYGGTAGLLTFEDVIEEIVGDIKDEYDEEEEIVYAQIDENTYIFEGKTSLADFCRVLGTPIEVFDPVKGTHESVGGLMIELFAKIPQGGEDTVYEQFTFTIEDADNKHVKTVKVHVGEKEENVSVVV